MGARVKLLLERRSGERLSARALLNGGFETRRPSVLLPSSAAKRLFRSYPKGSVVIPVEVATGAAELLELSERVWTRVIASGRQGPRVNCEVSVSEGADEILLSDTAIDALGVKVEAFGRGLWRFTDEKRLRKSAPIQIWK